MLVTGTATEIAGKGVADLVFSGMGVLFEEGYEGEEDAGGTKAALQAMFFPKALLEWVQLIRVGGEAFNGGNLVAVGLNCKGQTRADRLPIQQHRAGATHAMLTAYMRAGQADFMPEKIGQQQARFDGYFVGRAVYVEGDWGLGIVNN